MANPQLAIRIAANVDELKKNLAEGRGAIEALGPSVEKLQSTWKGSSDKLIQNANNITAAVSEIGTSTMTAGQAASSLKTLEQAMAQLERTGQPVPEQMREIAAELKTMAPATQSLSDGLGRVAGMFGIAFGAGAVIAGMKQLISHAIELGSEIDDASKKLGVSAEAYQGWVSAAKAGGATANDVVSAVGTMNRALDGGDDSTVAALKKAGLEFAQVRSMNPEQAFEAIATGVMKIPDPMTQARVATELFGKGAAQILPAIKDDIVKVGDAASKMSNETIRAMDAAGDALARLEERITQKTASSLGELALTIEELTKGSAGFGRVMAALWDSGGQQDAYIKALVTARDAVEGITEAEKKQIKEFLEAGTTVAEVTALYRTQATPAIEAYAKSLETAAKTTHLTAAEQRALEDAAKKSADAMAKHLDALRTLDTFSQDYRATLSTMNAKTVESVTNFLAAGASQEVLREAYKLTEGQIKAITLARQADLEVSKRQANANEELVRADQQALQASSKLWGEYHAMRSTQSGTATDRQIADIKRWGDEQARAFEASKNRSVMNASAVADFYDALSKNMTEKLGRVGVDQAALTDAATNHSKAGLQQIADAHRRTYEEALKHVGDWAPATIEKFRQVAEAAQQAANEFGYGFASALDPVPAKVDKIADSLQRVSAAMQTWSVASGSLSRDRFNSTAGDRSTEQIINDQIQNTNTGGIGFRPSVSTNSATSVPVSINVHGSMVGNQTELARLVEEAVKAAMKNTGARF